MTACLQEWNDRCVELNKNLPEEERINSGEFFEMLDLDHDGHITAEEMLDYLKVAGEMDQRSIYKRKHKGWKGMGHDRHPEEGQCRVRDKMVITSSPK